MIELNFLIYCDLTPESEVWYQAEIMAPAGLDRGRSNMSGREMMLGELGIQIGLPSPQSDSMRELVGPQAIDSFIPSISGYGEFTPISVRSYTVTRTENANVERNQRRD